MYSDPRESMELLAAELVLGTLDELDFRLATRRLESDARFAALVGRWSDWFWSLAGALPAMAPGDGVWSGIEACLEPRAAAPGRTARGATGSRGFRPPLPAWGLAAAAACVLVIAVAVTVSYRNQVAVAVATLAAADEGLTWRVSLDGRDGPLTVTSSVASGGRPVADHSLELWLVAADGRVTSLGLLPTAGGASLAVAPGDVDRLLAGATLAVSREPLGGSPSGRPTGPVIASTQFAAP